MCLISKNKYPGLMPYEREVYKIILCKPDLCKSNQAYWEAPIMHTHHEYNKVLSTNEYNIGKSVRGVFTPNLYVIGDGYFHAFTGFFYADHIREQLINNRNYDAKQLRVVKARIPKGSLYYEGHSGKEICSNKIIVDKDLFNYL